MAVFTIFNPEAAIPDPPTLRTFDTTSYDPAMKTSYAMLGPILLMLAGCDAWPTIMNNRSGHEIRYRYHQSSHEEWSAAFYLKAGEAQALSREHWVQDVTGLQVTEGGRRYSFDYASLAPLRSACSSMLLARRLKITPDCYLTYKGRGRVSASFTKPPKLIFHDFGNDR